MNSVQFMICCDKPGAQQARNDLCQDHRLQLRALRQRGGGGAAAGGERHRADRGAEPLMSHLKFSIALAYVSSLDCQSLAMSTSCLKHHDAARDL